MASCTSAAATHPPAHGPPRVRPAVRHRMGPDFPACCARRHRVRTGLDPREPERLPRYPSRSLEQTGTRRTTAPTAMAAPPRRALPRRAPGAGSLPHPKRRPPRPRLGPSRYVGHLAAVTTALSTRQLARLLTEGATAVSEQHRRCDRRPPTPVLLCRALPRAAAPPLSRPRLPRRPHWSRLRHRGPPRPLAASARTTRACASQSKRHRQRQALAESPGASPPATGRVLRWASGQAHRERPASRAFKADGAGSFGLMCSGLAFAALRT